MEEIDIRTVPGFEDYRIDISTKEGRCFSKRKQLSNKPSKRDGRVVWALYNDKKVTHHQAARWIAITFPELVQNEYFEGAEIDHIDTDPLNNHPSNLRWVDRYGQMNNPLTKIHLSEAQKGKKTSVETRKKMSEVKKGIQLNRPDQSKQVMQLSMADEELYIYPSTMQAERETGVAHTSISYCCNGKQSFAGGYKWKYLDL